MLSDRMPESVPNPIASATELVVRFGNQIVLNHASVTILEGERIGLVGRNGSGKSTFLQIAAGAMRPDGGELNRRRDLVVGYMPQMFALDEAVSVHANILAGAEQVLDLIREYESAPPASARSGILLQQIEHFDGWNLEHRIKSLITNLHAPAAERAVATLSGGEKRRVALCRALLPRPDFLILDEPTNHLDTGSIEWLEDFLARYNGTCLFVTHDRYWPLPKPALVISFQPHMHFRGSKMTLEAIHPDGRREILTSATQYEQNWQVTYKYKVPHLFPAGTILHVTSVHDNTANNKHNPDPTAWVGWGSRTMDEMGHGWTDIAFLSDEQYKEELAKRRAQKSTNTDARQQQQ